MRDPERGCHEFVELIMQHLDALLSPELTAQLETHLAGCAVCRAELLLQERIRDALTEEVHPRLSVDFTNVVTRKALEAARPLHRRSPWLSLVPSFGLLAVTLLLFALQNDFRTMLHAALGSTLGALAAAAGGVGQVFSRLLPATGGTPGPNLANLGVIAEPAMVALLLLVCVLPVVWCFRRVGEVLRG